MSKVRVYARRPDGTTYRVRIWHAWLDALSKPSPPLDPKADR